MHMSLYKFPSIEDWVVASCCKVPEIDWSEVELHDTAKDTVVIEWGYSGAFAVTLRADRGFWTVLSVIPLYTKATYDDLRQQCGEDVERDVRESMVRWETVLRLSADQVLLT
jgi:hypothetical protein